MRVIVQFCIDADVIECPEFVVNNLKVYASQFEKWFRDKKTTMRIGSIKMENSGYVAIGQKHL